MSIIQKLNDRLKNLSTREVVLLHILIIVVTYYTISSQFHLIANRFKNDNNLKVELHLLNKKLEKLNTKEISQKDILKIIKDNISKNNLILNRYSIRDNIISLNTTGDFYKILIFINAMENASIDIKSLRIEKNQSLIALSIIFII